MPNQEEVQANADFVRGLRELADFYEAHPEVKLPYHGQATPLGIYSATKEEVVTAARAFGEADKKYDGEYFRLKKTFSGKVALEFFVDRDVVCTPKVVGHRVIERQIIPAQIIQSQIVEILEYDCHPLLAPDPTQESTLPEEKE